jgi:hypothetical protein
MEGAAPSSLTLTIDGAARATGLSKKALRRRIERGSLPSTLVNGLRRVPVSALVNAGLLTTQRTARPATGVPAQADVLAEALIAVRRRLTADLSALRDAEIHLQRVVDEQRRDRDRLTAAERRIAELEAELAELR